MWLNIAGEMDREREERLEVAKRELFMRPEVEKSRRGE